ncbi:MAG: peptide chain release factor N(5)-glutamine methyltransferase [Alphaproteobacteria bacterium]
MKGAPTIAEALAGSTRWLKNAGVPAAGRDAEVLLGHVLRAGREVLVGHPGRRLTRHETARLRALITRRGRREPVAYLLGLKEFWSHDFVVTPDTLVPRPDSESVVEAVLAHIRDRAAPLSLLDFGTGSGCLLLALLDELPNAIGLGVDLSVRAVSVARANAERLDLGGRAHFLAGDWGRALAGRFDLVVANPPYVVDGEVDRLAPEIARFEPRRGLAGGPDGLACYRALAGDLARLLAPRGRAVLEVGAGQADRVASLMRSQTLVEVGRWRDLAGVERCLVLSHTNIRANATENAWKARES